MGIGAFKAGYTLYLKGIKICAMCFILWQKDHYLSIKSEEL
jgi:hypothetical protein